MKFPSLKDLNSFTKKQPVTLLSVAFVLLVLLVVSNVLVFIGLWKRDQVIRKMKKFLLVAREYGLALSEDMTTELGLEKKEEKEEKEKEVTDLAQQVQLLKQKALGAEHLEEEPEKKKEEEHEASHTTTTPQNDVEHLDEEEEEPVEEGFLAGGSLAYSNY